MRRLRTEKLHVRYLPETSCDNPVMPRCYTLTHSDVTGDLYLTIGSDYNRAQLNGWYTRLMRDEVLAEWQREEDKLALAVHCHVSGGLVFGTTGLRDTIFRRELPLALEALRFGDRHLFDSYPELDSAPVVVYFHARERDYNVKEPWGTLSDYR